MMSLIAPNFFYSVPGGPRSKKRLVRLGICTAITARSHERSKIRCNEDLLVFHAAVLQLALHFWEGLFNFSMPVAPVE